MRTATYRTDTGDLTIEYDPEAPCIGCGLPVVEASVGGTAVCPWCDMGIDRSGRAVFLRTHRKATKAEYAAAVAAMRAGVEA